MSGFSDEDSALICDILAMICLLKDIDVTSSKQKLNGSLKVIPPQTLFLQQQGNLVVLKAGKPQLKENFLDLQGFFGEWPKRIAVQHSYNQEQI